MTDEEVSVVSYIFHFAFGGAVAPPDMGVAYMLRLLPVLVLAYWLYKRNELDYLISQASV
jgi:hypothetical protein